MKNLISFVFLCALIYTIQSKWDWEKYVVKESAGSNIMFKTYLSKDLDVLKCDGITYVGHKGTEMGTFTVGRNPFSDNFVKFNFLNFPESCDKIPVEENPLEELDKIFEDADRKWEEEVQPHLDDIDELARRTEKTAVLMEEAEQYDDDDSRLKAIINKMESINTAPLPSEMTDKILEVNLSKEADLLNAMVDEYETLEEFNPKKSILRQQIQEKVEYLKNANIGTTQKPITYNQKLDEEIARRYSIIRDQVFVYSIMSDEYYRKAELKEEIRENVQFLKTNIPGNPAGNGTLTEQEFEYFLKMQLEDL